MVTPLDVLSSDRQYYVSFSGSDANDGTSWGTAWRTVQYADYQMHKLFLNGYNVTVQLQDGNWGGSPVNIRGPLLGDYGSLWPYTIRGNPADPAACFFDCPAQPFIMRNAASVRLDGMKLKAANGHSLHAVDNARVGVQNIEFAGSGPDAMHITANQGAIVAISDITGIYRISGGGKAHFNPNRAACITVRQTNIEILNNPVFTQGFVFGETCGVALLDLLTFTGTGFQGARYSLWSNSVCMTQVYPGSPPNQNYFPGTVAGHAYNGGQYN